jgi:hypothetical protein
MGKRKTLPDMAEAAFITSREVEREPVKAESGKRSRLTVDISGEVADAARSAVYWTPGLTLAGLIESGIRYEVERLEKERGEGFPSRPGDSGLKRGRPVR